MAEILPGRIPIENVFSMVVFDLDYENIEYGYRMDGPFNPSKATGLTLQQNPPRSHAKDRGGRDLGKNARLE